MKRKIFLINEYLDRGTHKSLSQENEDACHEMNLKSNINSVMKTTPIKSTSSYNNEEKEKLKSPAIVTAEDSILSQEAAALKEESTKAHLENQCFNEKIRAEESKC